MENLNEMNLIRTFSVQEDEEKAKVITDSLEKVTKYSMVHDRLTRKFADESFASVNVGDYNETNKKAKLALLSFCAEKAGIGELRTKGDLIHAMDNTVFSSIFNSIITRVIENIVLVSRPNQIANLATIENVEVGDSATFEIDPKGLPVAQRTSYTTNVTFLDGYSMNSITITPKPYNMGTTMDYIRILANDYDMGRELARVAAGLLYAQLRLVVEEIYSIAPVQNTPLYQANFNGENYVQMIEDLKMLNGGAPVTAYGTATAFYKIGATITKNFGFQSQDELIREGHLGRAYGIDNVEIDQFTDLYKPFNNTNATALRAVPTDRIILLSSVADKPVKLVRENFVRVNVKQPQDGSQYRVNYEYFMSFDAAIATQANYGIQAVNA